MSKNKTKNPKGAKLIKRDADAGRFVDKKVGDKPYKGLYGEANSMGVVIADPAVKPKGTKVRIIREAVSTVTHKR